MEARSQFLKMTVLERIAFAESLLAEGRPKSQIDVLIGSPKSNGAECWRYLRLGRCAYLARAVNDGRLGLSSACALIQKQLNSGVGLNHLNAILPQVWESAIAKLRQRPHVAVRRPNGASKPAADRSTNGVSESMNRHELARRCGEGMRQAQAAGDGPLALKWAELLDRQLRGA